jgi:hypothetical protein
VVGAPTAPLFTQILDKLKGDCFALLYFGPWQNISEFAEKVDLLDLCWLGYFTSSIIRTVRQRFCTSFFSMVLEADSKIPSN